MSKKTHKKSSGRAAVRGVGAKSAGAAPGKTRATAAKPSTVRSKARAPASPKAKEKSTSSLTMALSILAEGADAPAFSLPRDGGESVSLSAFRGRKLVLFFYPRADTPGCTREAVAFTALADDFKKSGTAVVGVSADSMRTQEKFRDKHKLAVPLVSDETHEMLEAYGVWAEKSMYGRKFLGIVRTTVLIGPDGRVARIWRNVKVDGHADEVLAAAQAL